MFWICRPTFFTFQNFASFHFCPSTRLVSPCTHSLSLSPAYSLVAGLVAASGLPVGALLPPHLLSYSQPRRSILFSSITCASEVDFQVRIFRRQSHVGERRWWIRGRGRFICGRRCWICCRRCWICSAGSLEMLPCDLRLEQLVSRRVLPPQRRALASSSSRSGRQPPACTRTSSTPWRRHTHGCLATLRQSRQQYAATTWTESRSSTGSSVMSMLCCRWVSVLSFSHSASLYLHEQW
jgi:hypothetical protein